MQTVEMHVQSTSWSQEETFVASDEYDSPHGSDLTGSNLHLFF